MICSITQQQAINPVVSKLSGHVFSKNIILKHLIVHKTCPFTGQPMSK